MAKANKRARKPDDDARKDVFRRESLGFFKKPELLTHIKTELDKDHIGDDREKMFTFCSETSSRLPPQYRFSTALAGYSSEGKTNLWKTTSKHLPREWYLDLTRATSATLEDDIHDIDLIYFGEEGANKNIVETVKQLVEDGISVMKKDMRDDNKSVRREQQPRKVGIYSTTHDANDEELATRYAVVSITGDVNKYTRVNKNTLMVAGDVDLEIDKRERSSCPTWITEGLRQLQPVDVVTVPYSHLLPVNSNKARSMRDLKRFLNLIRTLAWLHQHDRHMQTYRGKTVLYASPEDFWNAMEIGGDIFAQSLSGIEQRLQNVIQSYQRLSRVDENVHRFEKDGRPDPRFDETLVWVDRSLLQEDLGINSRDTIKSHVRALESKGVFASVWTSNRCFVAMKHASPTKTPTKDRLITHEQSRLYATIKKYYDENLVGKLGGKLVGGSRRGSSLLKFPSERIYHPLTTKKTRKKGQKKPKNTKISGCELVGSQKPGDVHKYILANGDEDKTVSYTQLKTQFSDRLITDMIEAQMLKIQPNGNYRYMEAIDNEQKD